ncbi:hypothetical protein ACRALDRAFT_1064940 [Sodiomyces alcalophilus JCM 7366]|uniref:uncharacterized protein n=1 Tax=Sodiomyces alcalophilus JCM 7366 TaxID=591952 RepID=UPI0039B43E51
MIIGGHPLPRLKGFRRLRNPLKSAPPIQDHCIMRAPWSSKSSEKRMAEDRQDIVMSVLQASTTRREAKGYLKKYASQTPMSKTHLGLNDLSAVPPCVRRALPHIQPTTYATDIMPMTSQPKPSRSLKEPPNVALVKLRQLERLDDGALTGIAKTLSHLRKLGLLGVIVLHQQFAASRDTYRQQTYRLQMAIDHFGPPGARVLDQIFMTKPLSGSDFIPSSLTVRFPHTLNRALDDEALTIIPPISIDQDMGAVSVVDPDDAILALVKYFSGLHSGADSGEPSYHNISVPLVSKVASVERIIILDPLGGIPLVNSESSHLFINLEQDFEHVMESLREGSRKAGGQARIDDESRRMHIRNLQLAQKVLAVLPETSAAVITTPATAAMRPVERISAVATLDPLNPLIHNLLTDKPVFSPSLPPQRVRIAHKGRAPYEKPYLTTVLKRGMRLTIYPDPAKGPWVPPRPGEPRAKLTDTSIDLPRLQFLIENSFGRKLERQHYLDRVDKNLAGVIVAGEYEGGAILTWEKPPFLTPEEAYRTGRLVPYLDKFAVLQDRQGSGGVADVVFNAMVRSCFPNGVCWRSKRGNPVNKWYFERSLGTYRLGGTNWQMFWTTPHVLLDSLSLRDYEDVCRYVEPSWVEG